MKNVKVINLGTSLKCHYYKIVNDKDEFFRKELFLNEEKWRNYFLNEVDFYKNATNFNKIQNFIPDLRSIDLENKYIDIEYIDHQTVINERYVDCIHPEVLNNFFDFSIQCLNYSVQDDENVFFYNKIKKINNLLLSNPEIMSTISLKKDLSKRLFLSHGDVLPKNLLLTKDCKLKVIDWEFWGYRPKFYDLALLYISTRNRTQKESILNFVKQNDGIDTFLLSLIIHVEKELRIHSEDDDLIHELDYIRSNLEVVYKYIN